MIKGKNKNSDICLYVDAVVPDELNSFAIDGDLEDPYEQHHLLQITDMGNGNSGDYFNFNGYDDWPDISNDGSCIVYMSQADNRGEIYWLDMRVVYTAVADNQELTSWPTRRLTFSNIGECTHPMVSNFNNINDPNDGDLLFP